MRDGKLALVLALALPLASGCAGMRKKTASSTAAPTVATTTGMMEPSQAAASDAEPNLRNRVLQSLPELETVRFDFDKAELRPDARATLEKNSVYLKAHAEATALVAGHCDLRGTSAYNLALGQRRAKAVREYYLRLGVPASRVGTISYGMEHPLCRESSEECHTRNRRAETLATYPADVSGLPRADAPVQP